MKDKESCPCFGVISSRLRQAALKADPFPNMSPEQAEKIKSELSNSVRGKIVMSTGKNEKSGGRSKW